MKVLITGTASGIVKGCAEFFLKENNEVYGFDKNISSIQHPKYTHFCLDIRDKSSYPEEVIPPNKNAVIQELIIVDGSVITRAAVLITALRKSMKENFA